MPRKNVRKRRVSKPRRKAIKRREIPKVATHAERVEHFAEEVEALGREFSGRAGVRRLYRSGKEKILGGVCGGIAEYLNMDPSLIRILWIIGSLAWGAGILLYIIAWIIIPRNPKHKWD